MHSGFGSMPDASDAIASSDFDWLSCSPVRTLASLFAVRGELSRYCRTDCTHPDGPHIAQRATMLLEMKYQQ